MNVYLYEVTSENYNRYVVQIADRLARRRSDVRVFYLRDTFLSGALDVPVGARVEVVPVAEVERAVAAAPPDVFVCFGHRVPDLYWTYRFKRWGARAAQVQHGLYTDYFPKSVGGFLSNPRRKFRYLRYVAGLLGSPIPGRLRTVASVLRKDLLLRGLEARVAPEVASDHIFVWGEYWKRWYREDLFYKDNGVSFTVCGSFDSLSLLDSSTMIRDEDGVAYICQTLVEDGRMKRGMFTAFVDRLLAFVESDASMRLYVRLHPRTDLGLYGALFEHPRVVATRKFPYVPRYIGHYSGLLSMCYREDAEVVLVHFPGLGHQVPEHLAAPATAHRDYLDDLDLSVFDREEVRSGEPFDRSFYWADIADPYGVIGDGVLALGESSGSL